MLLWERGPQQRLELSKALGVQPSTVTRIVNQLLKNDYIDEAAETHIEGSRGFPSKRLFLKPGKLLSAGIFIDPDRINSCVIDMMGSLLSEESRPITDASFSAVMKDASAMISQQIDKLGRKREDFFGCGISYPGQHFSYSGISRDVPYLPGWPQSGITEKLATYFDIPVYHLNDAKSACLAEMMFGSCRGEDDFCFVWLAHGIGGAAVIDKRLHIGKYGHAAEFGSLFPKTEPRPSGTDLLQVLGKNGHQFERMADISDDILRGKHVLDWCSRAENQLRDLCLTITCTYAPEKIAFGGQLPELVFERIMEGLTSDIPLAERVISPPKIVRATMDKRPHLGAASVPLYIGTRATI